MTDPPTRECVIVWPIADPKHRIHLADEHWRIRGLTLCARPIKGAAGEPDKGDACAECREIADREEAS